jgi:hypothetical protein
MNHRHFRWLLWLLVLVALGGMGQNTQAAADLGGEMTPLPPNPDDWVCKDSVQVVSQAAMDAWCSLNRHRGLPAPARLQHPPALADLLAKDIFDVAFQSFLRRREYATDLGWTHDLSWRLTGPYVGTIGSGLSFGVHPAVHVYYSPEMIDWLCRDRTGTIPDGAIIIKELHGIDASLDITLDASSCMQIQADVTPTSWTVLIKSSKASQDRRYWANYTGGARPGTQLYRQLCHRAGARALWSL